jgi:hypothetical protein
MLKKISLEHILASDQQVNGVLLPGHNSIAVTHISEWDDGTDHVEIRQTDSHKIIWFMSTLKLWHDVNKTRQSYT